MNTEINNQHTLYRFVSLRNPELLNKINQTQRFVFHPDNTTGYYFRQMNSLNTNDTKWQKLITISSSFMFIPTLSDLEVKFDKNFYAMASWIARNKSSFEEQFVLESISNLLILDINLEISLWDNLFYQIVTQNDFYIKENIMHILVLNNMLKEIKKIENQENQLNALSILANARVVIPTILFEEESNNSNSSSTSKTAVNTETDTKDNNELNIISANNNIDGLEKAKKEIQVLEKKYNKNYSKAYQDAIKQHEAITKPLIDKYQEDYYKEKRRLCTVPKPDNYDPNDFCSQPDINYPDLPEFNFELYPDLSKDTLRSQLSSESYSTLDNNSILDENDTYSEIYEKIDEAIKVEQKTIVDNTTSTIPILIIGGMSITINEKSIDSNSNSTLTERKIEDTNLPDAFVPEKFGVRNIGIADYKKVVSHVCCYNTGEVSHIENIMAKELRSKTTTRERIEEYTETTEKQQEKESLTDTTTTNRFEMQTEVSKILAEDKQAGAYTKYNYDSEGFGSLEVGANFATNSSKEESNRQAVTQAKDVTNRAMERIVTKIRKETVVKTTDRFTEENVHAYDNRQGEHHVSGIYRYINSVYKNQIYNYGKRMMYEFMIPQPNKLHILGMIENSNNSNAVNLIKPLDPRENGLPDASYINSINSNFWASKLGVEINLCPAQNIYVSKSFTNSDKDNNSKNENIDLKVPENYETIHAKINIFLYYNNSGNMYQDFCMTVGNLIIDKTSNTNPLKVAINTETNSNYILNSYTESIPISYQYVNLIGANIVVSVKCQLTSAAKTQWQNDTFNAIIKGYENKLTDYQNALAETQTSVVTNPGFYRQIEQLVLRKNCISYLMDESKMGIGYYEYTNANQKDLANYHLIQNQQMDNYVSYAKFMEQAFEWDLISYNFYPFYWGKREDWKDLYQYDCDDPLFRSFMQAGMARVIVTVKPGFENAIMHYMATGQVWNGGEVPVLGNPLYLSIVDELKEQEYTVDETWETIVPTALVALQENGVAIVGGGLPCGSDCKDHAGDNFKDNDAILGVVIKENALPTA